MLAEPERTAALLQQVTDLLEQCIVQFAAAGADGIFGEDWGAQDRLLVSPATWRRMFRPGFEQLCEAARRHGLDVMDALCGAIYAIIPDLVEVGIAVLQFGRHASWHRQPRARLRGKVNFWCPVDIEDARPATGAD